ncbi:unnamed protein product [Hermetia illucens]|uniref:Uncharacterized protein n=1 Tax=Hermetia illucens TaxID=343691 RepID=A0A7R8UM38_HERIL|nr:extensin-2 [Hermetia illucens]CAD7083345.1 unnamed protein product [Hermetia illucens]
MKTIPLYFLIIYGFKFVRNEDTADITTTTELPALSLASNDTDIAVNGTKEDKPIALALQRLRREPPITIYKHRVRVSRRRPKPRRRNKSHRPVYGPPKYSPPAPISYYKVPHTASDESPSGGYSYNPPHDTGSSKDSISHSVLDVSSDFNIQSIPVSDYGSSKESYETSYGETHEEEIIPFEPDTYSYPKPIEKKKPKKHHHEEPIQGGHSISDSSHYSYDPPANPIEHNIPTYDDNGPGYSYEPKGKPHDTNPGSSGYSYEPPAGNHASSGPGYSYEPRSKTPEISAPSYSYDPPKNSFVASAPSYSYDPPKDSHVPSSPSYSYDPPKKSHVPSTPGYSYDAPAKPDAKPPPSYSYEPPIKPHDTPEQGYSYDSPAKSHEISGPSYSYDPPSTSHGSSGPSYSYEPPAQSHGKTEPGYSYESAGKSVGGHQEGSSYSYPPPKNHQDGPGYSYEPAAPSHPKEEPTGGYSYPTPSIPFKPHEIYGVPPQPPSSSYGYPILPNQTPSIENKPSILSGPSHEFGSSSHDLSPPGSLYDLPSPSSNVYQTEPFGKSPSAPLDSTYSFTTNSNSYNSLPTTGTKAVGGHFAEPPPNHRPNFPDSKLTTSHLPLDHDHLSSTYGSLKTSYEVPIYDAVPFTSSPQDSYPPNLPTSYNQNNFQTIARGTNKVEVFAPPNGIQKHQDTTAQQTQRFNSAQVNIVPSLGIPLEELTEPPSNYLDGESRRKSKKKHRSKQTRGVNRYISDHTDLHGAFSAAQEVTAAPEGSSPIFTPVTISAVLNNTSNLQWRPISGKGRSQRGSSHQTEGASYSRGHHIGPGLPEAASSKRSQPTYFNSRQDISEISIQSPEIFVSNKKASSSDVTRKGSVFDETLSYWEKHSLPRNHKIH